MIVLLALFYLVSIVTVYVIDIYVLDMRLAKLTNDYLDYLKLLGKAQKLGRLKLRGKVYLLIGWFVFTFYLIPVFKVCSWMAGVTLSYMMNKRYGLRDYCVVQRRNRITWEVVHKDSIYPKTDMYIIIIAGYTEGEALLLAGTFNE